MLPPEYSFVPSIIYRPAVWYDITHTHIYIYMSEELYHIDIDITDKMEYIYINILLICLSVCDK